MGVVDMMKKKILNKNKLKSNYNKKIKIKKPCKVKKK